jgi:ParB family transcriptional regulator, chromosome partitioning protein
MSAPATDEPSTESTVAGLVQLDIDQVLPNEGNPRLDFPQSELDRLADSIDQEGILVPIVVYPKDGKYILVDGERRFRCARDLGLTKVPAVITRERPDREILQQMFNIHLIREPWRDIPTALALGRLADAVTDETGVEPTDKELAEMTGLSVDKVRQLRYVLELPTEWQQYIRSGTIPLNYFWELKKNVLDQLERRRPALLTELGADSIQRAFVQKRLDNVVTDTVSLRKVAPIIGFAEQEAKIDEEHAAEIDQTIRDLITVEDATINDAYEDTVQMLVEMDKLGRRTTSMVSAFKRLLSQAESSEDRNAVVTLANELISDLTTVVAASSEAAEA